MAKNLQPLTPEMEKAIRKNVRFDNEGTLISKEEFEEGFKAVVDCQKDLIRDYLEERSSG